jgi:putative transposase
MPRSARHIIPGAVYHLISQLVDREWFITRESERSQYLSLLGRALSLTDWRCLSYGIMSNHLHLAMVAGIEPLASWMRRVHSPFADWMNRSHERIGVMFVRGPKDILIPPERVRFVIAYIHNNPVRAHLVNEAAASTWTSHRAYLGLSRAPSWLHVEEGLERSGFTERAQFDSFVRAAPELAREDEDDGDGFCGYEPEVEAIRVAPRRVVIDPVELVRVAAELVGLSVDEVRSRRKQHKHVRARQLTARCGDRLGLTGVEIATALQASPQCVSRILTAREHDEDRIAIDRVVRHFSETLDGSRLKVDK